MNERIVKFRLVTYFDEVDNQVTPGGDTILVERTASMGQKISLRPKDEERLDSLGALYTDEEAKMIEDGTYKGSDAAVLSTFRGGLRPLAPDDAVSGAVGEGDPATMDAVALGQYIRDNRLNAEKTVALAGDDEESIQRVIDAENIATENSPRVTVLEPLEKRLADLPA